MLTAGIGLFGIVGWIQTDRYAFTHSRPAELESIQMVIAPAKPAEVRPAAEASAAEASAAEASAVEASAVEEPADAVLEMPEDAIVVPRRAPVAAPPMTEPELHEPMPCSPWEEIGPVRVDDGNPTGVRRYRKLC
jgi:hypothetical protein